MNERRFYVYEWYRKDKDEVFYVGKGTGNRRYVNRDRSKRFLAIKEKAECHSRIVKDNLTNEEACALEIEQIAYRWGKGEAYCNYTSGGTGFATGIKNPNYSRDWRGNKNPFYGRKHSEETKAKISKNRKGKGGQYGKANPMYGKGMKGKENPMYGRTGTKHPNAKKYLVTYSNGESEVLTSKACEKKFGIAFSRIRMTGGILTYKKNTKNKTLYEGTKIELI